MTANTTARVDSISERTRAAASRDTRDNKKTPKTPAAAASLQSQCRFHLKPTGCRDPANCKEGRHDPEFKGAGPVKGGDGKGTGGGGKGAKGSKEGKGGKGAKGAKGEGGKGGKGASGSPAAPAPTGTEKLEKGALKDAYGRRPCYPYQHNKCSEPCPNNLYHGPETEAMKTKRIEDEKRIKAAIDKKAAGNTSGGDKPTPKAKDKAKPKAGAKATKP